MSERLLTARDVAERVGVSTETVLRWTRRGVLPAIRLLGGQLRIRPEELERLLEEWEAGAGGRNAPTNRPGDARGAIVALRSPTNREEDEDDAR